MKFFSWNVNGIRAAVKKGFTAFLQTEQPDILMLQEIKIDDIRREKEKFDFKNYKEFWHPAVKPGYSGTALLVNENIKDEYKYTAGLGIEKFDREGRVQTLEFEKFYLVNIYFPHINHELTRLDFKLEFNSAVHDYVSKLNKTKPVIVGGDYNVAHNEIDLARPKDNIGNPGFTDEERKWMTKFLNSGYIDTYRFLNKKRIQYSWWGYRFNARARNIGWRLDYFCVSEKLKDKVRQAVILDKVMGSDHCPVGLEIKI